MNIAKWLERSATKFSERPALMNGMEVGATYSEFYSCAAALASWLQSRGIGPGDRVALFMKNCPEYLICMYGVWISGAAIVPINAKLHAKEANWILEDSEASLCFVTSKLEEGLEHDHIVNVTDSAFETACKGDQKTAESIGPEALAWLFYTSGTTGRPKGVEITHGMLTSMSLNYPIDVDQVFAKDAAIYAAPMSHGAGIYVPVHVLHGAAHMCPPSGGFDAGELLSLAREHGSLTMFMAPTMVQRLTRHARESGDHGEGLRTIVYGGGPMYLSDLKEALDWFGPKFVQIYGQGECPMAISALSRADISDQNHPDWARRAGSVGKAQSAVEVAIGTKDTSVLPIGETGEIMVRGAPVMPGYWKRADATRETLRNGWLMTGDIGLLDKDGYLTLKDRSKDVIISGGTNIYPGEVEGAILSHPGVAEVAVIGRPSPEWGEDVVAFVVTVSSGSVSKAELDEHCLSQIARFKRPKTFHFIDRLPKNNYGKVLKKDLRKLTV